MSNWKCTFFGHIMDEETNKYKKCCKRKNCLYTEVLMARRFPKIGEPADMWCSYEIDKISVQ